MIIHDMDILDRIKFYLGNGGLINPEAMEHDKVRDLILDCCEEIESLRAALATIDRLTQERNDADDYIRAIWRANQLPSPLGDRLFDRLTK